MTVNLLVFNAGSATLKWAVFSLRRLRLAARGLVERIGLPKPFAWYQTDRLSVRTDLERLPDHRPAVKLVLTQLAGLAIARSSIRLVGHRFVHGGGQFQGPTVLTAAVLKRLERFDLLAPLHNPVNRLTATVARQALPESRHLAVFDTAYFVKLPAVAQTYALPRTLSRRLKLRRYGFHGLSHAWAARQASHRLGRRLNLLNLITVHLGSGCSITAVRRGQPVDTSMGFTPLEGLVMMSRGGDLDPGILLHLLRSGWTLRQLDRLLNYRSGILGLTGSRDFRDVRHALGERDFPLSVRRLARRQVQFAFDLFIYRLRKYLGAYGAILGRVDAVVFTGAIGERSAKVQRAALAGLPLPGQPRRIVVSADEERVIAEAIVRQR